MNGREPQEKTSQNKFRDMIDKRVASSKKQTEKKVLSPEKLEAKAAGYEAFLKAKEQRKRLKNLK